MLDGDLLVRKLGRVGGDLSHDRFQPLPHRGGPQIDGERAVGLEHQSRVLARPRRATLDEAADGKALIVAIDQLTAELALFGPAKFLHAEIEHRVIVAAVELRRAVVGRHAGERIRHLAVRDEIAPAQFDAVDLQILGNQVDHPFTNEIRLEPSGPAIGAARRLVGGQHRGLEVDMLERIRPRHVLRDVTRTNRAVGSKVGADVRPGLAPKR